MKHLFLIIFFLPICLFGQTSSTQCAGDSNPTVTVIPSGGTAPYVVTWTSPSASTSTGTTVTLTEAGIWQWVVEDATSCPTEGGTHIFTIEPSPLSGITINAVNKCSAASQTISATGVPAGYTYAWNFGSGASPATSATASVNVTYSTGGTKTITLSITKSFPGIGAGCSESCIWTKTKTITIGTLTGVVNCN